MLKIERDKVYVTGNGKRVRVVCIDNTAVPAYPVIGVCEEGGDIDIYTPDGQRWNDSISGGDLLREVKEKKVLYLNLYPNNTTIGVYLSKQKADKRASNFRTARIRVEYEEGQFDE